MDELPPNRRRCWQEEIWQCIAEWMDASSEGMPAKIVLGQTMKNWRILRRVFGGGRAFSRRDEIGPVVDSEAWLPNAQKKLRFDDLVKTVHMSSSRWMERLIVCRTDHDLVTTREMLPR